jgi:hypothetical protein
MVTLLDTSDFKEISCPEEIKGAWFYYVFFKNHPNLGGICCVYLNDKYPSGSVCIGDYILNDYPDIYSVWKNDDINNALISERFFVSPVLRNKGLGKAALYYGGKVIEHLTKKKLIRTSSINNAANRLFSSAFDVELTKITVNPEDPGFREEFFDQPIYPYVFFGKRVSV